MKFALSDGQELNLKPLSDADYDWIGHEVSLNVCPTCGGRDVYVVPGIKSFEQGTYRLDGEEHECNCQAQLALFARYFLANIGIKYMRLDWNDFHGTKLAAEWVGKYLGNWHSYLLHGYGLTFSSKDLGVGKTWAATHIGKELIKERQKVYFQDFAQMVDAFCGDREDKRHIEEKMKKTTFLIIDDVLAGMSERQNDLYAMKFEVVIRHRTNFNRPTIFTTNLTEKQFEQEFPRIYSLTYGQQKWIEMSGSDHRKRGETKAKTDEMIEAGEVSPIT